jgi:hypothetical protein
LLLSIGFCVIALLLIWAVVDASAIFLARRDLAAAVDGTALAAVQQVDSDELYANGARGDLPLDPDKVAVAVETYVESTYPRRDFPEQRIVGGVDDSGHAVAVRGERDVRLPVFGTVTVTARASAVNHRRGDGGP